VSDQAPQVAFVTGAGRNIGRAIAIAFARQGLAVAVNNRHNAAEGKDVVAAIESFGGTALHVSGDVGVPGEAESAIAAATTALGPIDVLVNNAAVRPHTNFADMSLDEWQWVLAVGLTGAFVCTRAVVASMIDRHGGCIINVSGRDGFEGRAARAHGATVKAGLHGFTKALARELGPSGIRVNTVVPSLIDTTRPPEWYPGWADDADLKRIPVRHLGRSEDIADACVYLLGASYVTGQALHVNGGVMMI
jgi:NAD(P)-dependent dehydrogenase (short-subunit alcohol dehydrogenase family)